MRQDYHKFKKDVLTRDNYTCECGSKAIHMIFMDPLHKIYNCASYQLVLDVMESVCLKCYYVKLNATTKKESYHQKYGKIKNDTV